MFFDKFARLCKEKGVSETKVGDDLGLSKGGVYYWRKQYKKGIDAKPNPTIMKRVADYFGVSVDYFLTDEPETETEQAKVETTKTEIQNFIPLQIKLYDIPIFNSVSAGFGTIADSSIVDYIALPFSNEYEPQETFCVKVVGDSMQPEIKNGDLIQITKQTSVDNGDIAVVYIDDEAFVKKITYGTEWVKLTSLNPEYGTKTLKGADLLRCRVAGKVKRVIREL